VRLLIDRQIRGIIDFRRCDSGHIEEITRDGELVEERS
jgi:hypothetical protein